MGQKLMELFCTYICTAYIFQKSAVPMFMESVCKTTCMLWVFDFYYDNSFGYTFE